MAFKLSDERYEEIKQKVIETFECFDIKCVPISGFEIATKLGATVIPYSAYSLKMQELLLKQSNDAFSILKDDLWYVYYNDSDSIDYRRINNTMMHECGHIVLDHSEDSELANAEANFFAKYALAPPALIHKLGLKNAYEIRDAFDISSEAACYALLYYKKWINYGGENYTDYEQRLLWLFNKAM